VDFTQNLRRVTHNAYIITDELRISWFAIFDDVNPIRRRRYTLFKESLAKQGVDERGFPAVKFTDDDEQEEFVELIESLMQVLAITRFDLPGIKDMKQSSNEISLSLPDRTLMFIQEP
jgi:hypothetical protein